MAQSALFDYNQLTHRICHLLKVGKFYKQYITTTPLFSYEIYFKQYAQLAVKQSKKSLPIVKHISTYLFTCVGKMKKIIRR